MNIEIANRLAALRKEKGISQEELAEKLGVSRQAVSKWENGESSPDTDNLIALADIYGISLDELLGKSKPEEKVEKEEVEVIVKDPDDDDDDDDDDEDEDERHGLTRLGFAHKVIGSIGFLVATIAFLLVGFLWKGPTGNLGWACGWVIFFIPIIIQGLIFAIEHRRPSFFPLPILIVGVYCATGIIGNAYGLNLWHPYWVEFIFIPIYYGIVRAMEGRR